MELRTIGASACADRAAEHWDFRAIVVNAVVVLRVLQAGN